MRTDQEMLELILGTAQADDRIRAVILNGSRANPFAPRDIFQDFDIVYVVTDVQSFHDDPHWIDRFGERMILQMPDEMGAEPGRPFGAFAYLVQFMDGNRIDLTIYPADQLDQMEEDSLSVLLLDKDGLVPPLPPPNESTCLPKPPTAKQFADCCNEFWWVSPYVAKGLWRGELPYAKSMYDQVVHEQLMRMLTWYIGIQTGFIKNPGKYGKYFQTYLEPELYKLLEKTYPDGDFEHIWQALFAMGDLFRRTAQTVAAHFGYDYPHGDDERVTAHLRHVHTLPKDAPSMY